MNGDDYDFKDEIDEIEQELLKLTPEKRIKLVIDAYFELEDPDEQVRSMFLEWLSIPKHSPMKDTVMERKLEEMIDRAFGANIEN